MSGFVLTILLFVIGSGFDYLPIVENNLYFSNDKLRADRLSFALTGAQAPIKKDILSLGPQISAQAALVADLASGAILYNKNAGETVPLASLTKLMTTLIFLESNPDLSKQVIMTEGDERAGADHFIAPGEEASLLAYLKASLLASANNATMVLSREASGGDEQDFVKKMNGRANQLGMNKTIFVEPTGLDPGNISTAADVSVLLSEIGKFKIVADLTSRHREAIIILPEQEEREIINTNQLINSLVKVRLGKTGFLEESMYNLATVLELKNGKKIAVITLGSASSQERWQDNKVLGIWAEATYQWQ